MGGHTVLSGNYLRAPSAKSDWIFWSLARLIDLTKSQKKKKSIHVSTGSRDYSPGSLTGAKQGIVVLTDLTSSWGLGKMAPQRRARARTHRPETPVVWPFNGTDTSTLPCRSPHIYHGQLCAAGQVLVCTCSPVRRLGVMGSGGQGPKVVAQASAEDRVRSAPLWGPYEAQRAKKSGRGGSTGGGDLLPNHIGTPGNL